MCIASATHVPVQSQACEGQEANEALPACRGSLFQGHLGGLAGHGQGAAAAHPGPGEMIAQAQGQPLRAVPGGPSPGGCSAVSLVCTEDSPGRAQVTES